MIDLSPVVERASDHDARASILEHEPPSSLMNAVMDASDYKEPVDSSLMVAVLDVWDHPDQERRDKSVVSDILGDLEDQRVTTPPRPDLPIPPISKWKRMFSDLWRQPTKTSTPSLPRIDEVNVESHDQIFHSVDDSSLFNVSFVSVASSNDSTDTVTPATCAPSTGAKPGLFGSRSPMW